VSLLHGGVTMRIVRVVSFVLGSLMVLLGLVWIGQGSGYFPYPAESFMINQTPWIYWGLVLAAAGLIIIAISRKLRK
jgi:hypothetical protein